eukprot:GILK01003923.1.p1 GENE.GILK01003923.1~~GILK01003923.1.p1  ORF type:complete len:474 (+),score=63.84 GILK01003923.1:39-1460(+)
MEKDKPSSVSGAERPKYPRAVLCFALLQALLTSGAIFGWAPMELILQDDGAYRELCPEGEQTCAEQKKRLNLIFTIASSLFLFSLPTGYFLDRYGPRWTCTLGSFFFGVGTLLVAISDSKELDLFCPGFCLIAFGGPPVVFSFIHLSNLFPANKATIIGAFNIMIDCSAVDFALVEMIYSNLGLSRKAIFIAYTVIIGAMCIASIFLWPDQPYKLHDVLLDAHEASQAVNPLGTDLTRDTVIGTVKSKPFLFAAVYAVLQLFRCNFYLGTVDSQLQQLADTKETAELWTRIFAWILPAGGVICVPIVGYFLDRKGLVFSLFVLNVSATLSALFGCIDNLWVQSVTFIIFAFWRAFHFSAMASYVAILFGIHKFGTCWGTIYTISSFVNVAAYFLVSYIMDDLHGNFQPVNYGLTAMSACLFVFPLWLFIKSRAAVRVQSVHTPLLKDEPLSRANSFYEAPRKTNSLNFSSFTY